MGLTLYFFFQHQAFGWLNVICNWAKKSWMLGMKKVIIATIIILIIIITISCPMVQNAEIETRKLKRGISSEDWIICKQYNNF